MDFTLSKYKELIESLLQAGFSFQTFEEFLQNPKAKVILLRHDVDLLPQNSFVTAQIEYEMGIKGSKYLKVIILISSNR